MMTKSQKSRAIIQRDRTNRLHRRCWLKGYTLLELIAVLAVMAILAGVGTIKFADSLQQHRCFAAGERLVQELENLKTTAVLTSQASTAFFDTQANSVQLMNVRMPDGGAIGDKTILLSQESGSPFFERLNFEDNSGSISFNGYGMPSCGGSLVIRVGQHCCTVLIDSRNGAIRLVHRAKLDAQEEPEDDDEER